MDDSSFLRGLVKEDVDNTKKIISVVALSHEEKKKMQCIL